MSLQSEETRRQSSVHAACRRAEDLVAQGAPIFESLAVLVAAAEEAGGAGVVSSILLIDQDGLLRNGSSPNLPRDYLNAIDRLKPDPNIGTCAAAAATGQAVMTPDFRADEKWAELRHLPMELGFAGAWSLPIKDTAGRVLGTFGTYFRESREPTPAEQRAVERLAVTAARAIVSGRPTSYSA